MFYESTREVPRFPEKPCQTSNPSAFIAAPDSETTLFSPKMRQHWAEPSLNRESAWFMEAAMSA